MLRVSGVGKQSWNDGTRYPKTHPNEAGPSQFRALGCKATSIEAAPTPENRRSMIIKPLES